MSLLPAPEPAETGANVGFSPTPVPAPSVLEIARHERRKRVRSAMTLARRHYPGPVGEVLASELDSWDPIGSLLYTASDTSLIMRLCEHLEQLDQRPVIENPTVIGKWTGERYRQCPHADCPAGQVVISGPFSGYQHVCSRGEPPRQVLVVWPAE